MRAKCLVTILLMIGCFSAAHGLLAQDTVSIIDGSVNPELTPDDVAFIAVFRALAEPEGATPAQRARQSAKLTVIGLGESEITEAAAILARFQESISNLDREARELAATSDLSGAGDVAEAFSSWKQRREDFRIRTYQELKQSLSLKGMARLEAFVTFAKRNMRIIPE